MNAEEICVIFPGLTVDPHFRIASPHDPAYNCFAWAAGDDHRWWDPVPLIAPTRAGVHWPAHVPVLLSRAAFIAAYATIGYEVCADPKLEEGFEKIALYENADGEPVHAARQLDSGVWTSKLGRANDIEHGAPETIEAPLSGAPALFLRRPRQA